MNITKGQLEGKISEAIIKFEKEYMGRGPLETKTFIIGDMILVRLKGVLTKAESQLVNSGNDASGRELVKKLRIELLEKGRPLLEHVVKSITLSEVISLHSDISVKTGERVIIFTMDRQICS
jgi:uncharacterized protein YbcI